MQEDVPFDPDFDAVPQTDASVRSEAPLSSVVDMLGPRRAFFAGFILSCLVLMSIGFAAFLSTLLSLGSVTIPGG